MIISLNRGGVITGNVIGRDINTDALYVFGGTPGQHGARVDLYGADSNEFSGYVSLKAENNNSYSQFEMSPGAKPVYYINGTRKTLAMREDVVPRSGGAVMTGQAIGRTCNDSSLMLFGGTGMMDGASIEICGANYYSGMLRLVPRSYAHNMFLRADGTFTWDGTPIQYTSDQRLKQQIVEIDDKLLDAWEDVDLVQFKYNDAVDQKGDTARLHTGYVVQQIDEACKSHNLDISAYGLYCHEEYPERTEEVTTENEDGTTSKETKVIEPAREHYSLRYTEVYAVECMYLRRCIKRLTARIEELEKGDNIK